MQFPENNQKAQEMFEIDLFAMAQLLWAKKFLIIFVAFIGAVLLYGHTRLFKKPLYTASVYMYANNYVLSTDATNITSSDLQASAKLVDTYGVIIKRDYVLQQILDATGIESTPRELASCMSVSSQNNTEVFQVAVTWPDPVQAADLANAVADIAPGRIGDIVDGCSVKIVDRAKVPTSRSSPSYSKAAIMGFLIGFILSAGIIVLLDLLDTSIKSENDLEKWEIPVMGVIPEFLNAEKQNKYRYNYNYGYGKKKKGTDKK